MRQFPLLNVKQDDGIVATAGVNFSVIPSVASGNTLRAMDVLRLCWLDANGDEYKPLVIITSDEVDRLPWRMKQSQYTELYPTYGVIPYYQSSGQAQINWIATPGTTLNARLTYRKVAALFNIYDVGQSTATASGTVTTGAVTSIAVTAPGYGYTVAPVVTITGGAGATAIAHIADGVVTSITVTAGGSGFTTAAVSIAAPTVTISQIPDYIEELYGVGLAMKLSARNIGWDQSQYAAFSAEYERLKNDYQHEFSRTPYQQANMVFSAAGRPQTRITSPFANFNFLGMDSDNYGYNSES